MLVEVLFEDLNNSLVIDVETHVETVKQVLPFKSKAVVWKHEIYFSTPINISFSEKDLVYSIKKGLVYYWPPEKAMCIFYGFSHPYTPVVYLGSVVDPLHTIENWSGSVHVYEHSIDKRFDNVIEKLVKMGYKVATPLRNGERVVVAYKKTRKGRLSLIVYPESYGVHIESEGMIKYSEIGVAPIAYRRLLRLVTKVVKPKYARFDISENNYIVVTAGLETVDKIEKALNEIEKMQTMLQEQLLVL